MLGSVYLQAIRATFVVALLSMPAGALVMIRGGEGNEPLRDPGWPAGTAALFNHRARVAWWEGPPFGGGEWHSECRGDAKDLQALIEELGRLKLKNTQIIVHEGVGRSFWLNPNREPGKKEIARIDWALTVWEPARWDFQRNLPVGMRSIDPNDVEKGAPTRLDVYAGGKIRWPEIKVPDGLPVLDLRLEANGFAMEDGSVFKGKVRDLESGKPIAARARFRRVESQPTGGYKYTDTAEAKADAQGNWVLRNAPQGWFQLVIDADGFVPHVIGYAQPDGEPNLDIRDGGLIRGGSVSGIVRDELGRPLAGVDVRLDNVSTASDERYEVANEAKATTGDDGRFRIEGVPVGKATAWIHKEGYCRPGLGAPLAIPTADLSLSMLKAAQARILVDFGGRDRPGAYIVQIVPEGGEAVGKWSGSATIDPEGRASFQDVPPGKYLITGRPNPGGDDEQAGPIAVDLKGGETAEIKLKAR
ncbi:MAG: carboxypeptidase-like regulatory domain-containing protein [Isosphaeraceae bacterium]